MRKNLLTLLLALLVTPSIGTAQTSDVFRAAAERTAGIDTYEVQFSVRARGTMAAPRARTPPAGEVLLSDLEGIFAAGDTFLLYRSPDVAALGYDPQRGIEMVMARGNAYAVGPLPLSGAHESRWYNLGPRASAQVRLPLEVAAVLDDLTGGVTPTQLTRARFEQLDGKRCTVYRGGREAVVAALVGLGRAVTNETDKSVAQQLAGVRMDKAEYLAWVCDDGYIRQVRVTATGYQQQRPSLRFGADIVLRLSAIGSRTLAVTPPIDAVKLRAVASATASVIGAGEIRQNPSDAGLVFGQLQDRERVTVLDRTADSRWYRVRAGGATGWVPASLLRIPPGQRRVPVVGEAPVTLPGATAIQEPQATPTPTATP